MWCWTDLCDVMLNRHVWCDVEHTCVMLNRPVWRLNRPVWCWTDLCDVEQTCVMLNRPVSCWTDLCDVEHTCVMLNKPVWRWTKREALRWSCAVDWAVSKQANFVPHPDMTLVVDWALKTNYLAIWFLPCWAHWLDVHVLFMLHIFDILSSFMSNWNTIRKMLSSLLIYMHILFLVCTNMYIQWTFIQKLRDG